MTASAAGAQSKYADIAVDMAKQGKAEAERLLKNAPMLLDEMLERAKAGQEFDSAQYCWGALQSAVNLGAALSNIMPFSKVWTFEDDRGPVGRFRVMINGDKIHADVYCEDNVLRIDHLPWGIGSADPKEVRITAFSAIAGVALNLKLQGAFEGQGLDALEEPVDNHSSATNPAIEAPPLNLVPLPKLDAEAEPLSEHEKAILATEIQSCWNVGSLSSEALQISVTVTFSMDRSGRPDAESISIVTHDGSNDAAAAQAFEAARRAIIRCGAGGFRLPEGKYAEWQTFTLVFNPVSMRVQ